MIGEQTLSVPGEFKYLAEIAAFISKAAAQAGLTDKAVYQVAMAVDEACTNIIEHAYGGEGKGDIHLNCSRVKNGFQVIITDQGRPFDPNQIKEFDPQIPLAERQRGGMGVFFIRNLVDQVEYKLNTSAGNKLILFKQRLPNDKSDPN